MPEAVDGISEEGGFTKREERAMIKKTKLFYNEVQSEMKKVSWPTREELTESTVIVMISVAVLAVFIGVVDFVLSRMIPVVLR